MKKTKALFAFLFILITLAWACIYEASSGAPVEGLFHSNVQGINDSSYPKLTGDEYNDVLSVLNYYRKKAGLLPVIYDENLSKGCYNHVKYMVQNNIFTHEEDPNLPGYSESGFIAGSESLLAQYSSNMVEAIELWINSLYHRLPLLEPGLKKIGWHFEQGFAALNVTSGWDFSEDDYNPILFPAPQQTNFYPVFNWKEIPSPLPQSYEGTPGNFITISFNPYCNLNFDDESIKLYDNLGHEMDIIIKYPHDLLDKNALFQRNTIAAIPVEPLNYNSVYTVEVSGQVNNENYYEIWSFSTCSSP